MKRITVTLTEDQATLIRISLVHTRDESRNEEERAFWQRIIGRFNKALKPYIIEPEEFTKLAEK